MSFAKIGMKKLNTADQEDSIDSATKRRPDWPILHGNRKSLQQTLQWRFRARFALLGLNPHRHQRQNDREKNSVHSKRNTSCADPRNGKSRNRRTQHARSHWKNRGVQRNGVRQIFFSNHLHEKRLADGHIKRVYDPHQERNCNQRHS